MRICTDLYANEDESKKGSLQKSSGEITRLKAHRYKAHAADSQGCLIIKDITKVFGKTKVLSDVTLEVPQGELCVLLGPSGCGKSTLLRIIAGLESPSAGQVFIEGRDVTNVPPGKRDIAMVFQNYAIYPHMTVFDNIAFPLKVKRFPKTEIRTRVNEVATLLQLDQLLDRKPSQLSGGERQRTAMGRAIVRQPKVFLFDEPLSNLDAKLRANMRIEISLLHRKLRATTIYVTHDQVEAMTMADTIAVMDKGAIQQIDKPEGIYGQPANLMVAEFVGTPPMNLISGTLTRSDAESGVIFASRSLDFAFPQCNIEGEAVAGIRPEHVSINDSGKWIGRVQFVEDVGSDKYVHVELTGTEKIVVRAAPRQEVSIGESVRIFIDETQVKVFPRGNRIC